MHKPVANQDAWRAKKKTVIKIKFLQSKFPPNVVDYKGGFVQKKKKGRVDWQEQLQDFIGQSGVVW